MRRFLAATVSALALAGVVSAQELKAKVPTVDSADLAGLADQLADRDYRVRESAGKKLGELGIDALPTLRKVAESGNLEATDRAADLIAKIEWRLGNAKSIEGTAVELKAEEQTLGAAFDSLRNQTGYTIQINGDQSPRSKKLTPKAGKAIFWNALDALLADTDLEVQSVVLTAAPINLPTYGEPQRPMPSVGNVLLRQKTTKTANPVCISGAFRIEAVPVPVANLPQMPANRVPVLLQITPEPRLRWIGTTQTLVTMAKDQVGRVLPWDFIASDFQANLYAYEGRGGKGLGRRGYYGAPMASPEFPASQFQAYVKLLADPTGTSDTLKTLEGKVRGKIWSQPETMLAISELSESFQSVQGHNRLSLKAKYEPMPGDAAALLLSVTTTYNSSEVIPQHGSSALQSEALWIENGPGGRAKVKLSPEERARAQGYTNAYGLTLVDGHGKPMNLSPHTATQQNYYDGTDGSSTFITVAQYVVRPADKATESKPAKIAFNGTRIKSLEIPFQLKDVAVLRGAGTNVQNRSTYEMMDR